MSGLMAPEQLEAAIRAVGAERYHDKHPFHRLLHGGKLDKGQVQAWALNRFCYQSAVPRKDAALMSRTLDRELRREWIHRMLDHDGSGGEAGGTVRAAGRLRRSRALQVQRAVGPARRPAPRLRHPGPDPARCLPAGTPMSERATAAADATTMSISTGAAQDSPPPCGEGLGVGVSVGGTSIVLLAPSGPAGCSIQRRPRVFTPPLTPPH